MGGSFSSSTETKKWAARHARLSPTFPTQAGQVKRTLLHFSLQVFIIVSLLRRCHRSSGWVSARKVSESSWWYIAAFVHSRQTEGGELATLDSSLQRKVCRAVSPFPERSGGHKTSTAPSTDRAHPEPRRFPICLASRVVQLDLSTCIPWPVTRAPLLRLGAAPEKHVSRALVGGAYLPTRASRETRSAACEIYAAAAPERVRVKGGENRVYMCKQGGHSTCGLQSRVGWPDGARV